MEYSPRSTKLSPEPVCDSDSSGFMLDGDRERVRSVFTPARKPPLTADVIRSTTGDIINNARHSTPSKRRMDALDDESRFMLPNLSAATSSETLRNSLFAANIPDDA